MSEFFDRNRRPITVKEWAALMEDPSYRNVNVTFVEGHWAVSTIWSGIDGLFGMRPGAQPLIYETAIFDHHDLIEDMGYVYPSSEVVERYSSLRAARAGHKQWTRRVRRGDYKTIQDQAARGGS